MKDSKLRNLLYLNGKFCYNPEPLPKLYDGYKWYLEYEDDLQHWKDSAREVKDWIEIGNKIYRKYSDGNLLWSFKQGHIYQLDFENEPEVL